MNCSFNMPKMPKKHDSTPQPPLPPPPARRSFPPLLITALAVGVLSIALVAYLVDARRVASPLDATPEASALAAQPLGTVAADTLQATAPPANARFGPHKQARFPVLPFPAYATPRPPEVMTAVYHFAAEHPEVLGYVPCFCGCQRSGHRGNDDCFVAARAANGDVTAWEPHGMECAICIDVAHQSMQMHASGASVAAIRTGVEQTWASRSVTKTPTPPVPKQP